MIAEWGQPAVFVQQDTTAYNPNTGVVTPTKTRTEVKIVIARLNKTELSGLYQETDVKILIDPGQIGNHYVSTDDWFEVPVGGSATPELLWDNASLTCDARTGDYLNGTIENPVGGTYCTDTDYRTPDWNAGVTPWDNADFNPRSLISTQVMKVIAPRTYRGENPVFFSIIARPQ